jgi:hypothetical protein
LDKAEERLSQAETSKIKEKGIHYHMHAFMGEKGHMKANTNCPKYKKNQPVHARLPSMMLLCC